MKINKIENIQILDVSGQAACEVDGCKADDYACCIDCTHYFYNKSTNDGCLRVNDHEVSHRF